jgi:hypothetical protein
MWTQRPQAAPRPWHLKLIGGATALAAAAVLAGCGGPTPPVPGENGTINPDSTATVGSYSVMADWDGCPALDDLAPIEEFMGVVDWGTNGLNSTGIPGGMDGEAFNCESFLATLPSHVTESTATGTREWPGSASVNIGVAPWDDEAEAEENFDVRVEQLQWALETGGTEYTNVTEGEFAGDWDQTYLHAGNSSTGYVLSAIARQSDLVIYAFIDYVNDPGAMDGTPVYPFTDATLTDWVLNTYLPETIARVLALKTEGVDAVPHTD